MPITKLTISFVESRHPRKLLEYFRKICKFKIKEKQQEIYTIDREMLPIQVIDSSKLSLKENLWLKGLNKNLDPATVIRLGEEAKRHGKNAKIYAYMNVLSEANYKSVEEAIKMRSSAKSLEEVLIRTGLAAKWEARAEARGEKRRAMIIAKKMLNSGYSVKTVKALSK